MTGKKIVIHDYAGHPFQLDLSIALAKNGFEVFHIYTSSSGGPKAGFEREISNLKIINFEVSNINKSNFVKRYFQERDYGLRLVKKINQINPDIVISANTPLTAQNNLCNWCRKNDKKFIFWLQDIISVAASSILVKKIGFLGKIVSWYFEYLERKILNRSDAIVSICDQFNDILAKWNINTKSYVIPNWAPIKEMPMHDKNKEWLKKHNINQKFVCLYSGTMGMKHNPDVILDAAKKISNQEDIVFVIISEGEGANYLKENKEKYNLKNIMILPFQNFSDLPMIFGCSDALITILEDDAGVFSVPSKLWSYYCSGKPSILSVPKDNLTALITNQYKTGLVSTDKDIVDLIIKIKQNKNEIANKMGANARSYAEENFHIDSILEKFLNVL